ncbi:MAG: hypothetical protein ACO1TE_29140 [Prosthecobacter sp.]
MNSGFNARRMHAVAITAKDGREFLAHASPCGSALFYHIKPARAHKRDLRAHGFKCRVVNVEVTITVLPSGKQRTKLMNKYRAQSLEAQKARKKARKCDTKRRYATRDEALQKGQEVYQCHHCHGWHRSGQIASLAAELRTANREPRTS